MRLVIQAGVIAGIGSIIVDNSVVTKDVEAGVVVGSQQKLLKGEME